MMEITEKTEKMVTKTTKTDEDPLGTSLKSLLPTLIGLVIFTLAFALIARYIEYKYGFYCGN